ncbi:uncharacterized LOC729966 homolog isoform X2 [Pseudophryne corroboree]|uniref:uncharacterized LOC729966 homolog isoform X2 n=1 Tax=Pseudophryne corroboree TaxID=495146 RepID=UPI00308131F6
MPVCRISKGAENNTTPTTLSTAHPASNSAATGGTSSTLNTTATTNSTGTVTTSAISLVTNDTTTKNETEHTSATISTPHMPEAVTDINNHTGSTHSISNFTTQTPDRTQTSYNASIPGDTQETYKGLSDNPGLVAVICIFVCLLCIALTVTAVKFCQRNDPEFKKLDEVPMNGMNEEAPFARYPPK